MIKLIAAVIIAQWIIWFTAGLRKSFVFYKRHVYTTDGIRQRIKSTRWLSFGRWALLEVNRKVDMPAHCWTENNPEPRGMEARADLYIWDERERWLKGKHIFQFNGEDRKPQKSD